MPAPRPSELACRKCGVLKSLASFSRNKTKKHGVSTWCKECHGTYARTWESNNAEKVRESKRQWASNDRAENPEKHKEADNRYRLRNPEKRLTAVRVWRAANVEYCREYDKTYYAQFPERAKVKYHRRRSAAGVCTPTQLAARVAFFGGRCAYCGGPYEHLDHVIPIIRGGTNWPANLRPSCRACNLSKGQKPLRLWKVDSYTTQGATQ